MSAPPPPARSAPTGPPRRVLVTGASGNVATALLRRLAREGVEVVAVARRVPGPGGSPAAGATWHGIDLAGPAAGELLAEAARGVDAVVHCAWAIQPSHDRERMRSTNVEGTRAVARAAVEVGAAHLVHLSSVGVYAPVPAAAAARGDKPVTDESWPRTGVATSPYSRDKVAAEDLLDDLEREAPGLVVTRVRPGLVLQREAASEIARYFAGPFVPVSLLGRLHLPALPLPAAFAIPVVHADDLADALWRALAARLPGPLDVATAPPLSADDLARALGAARRVGVPLALVRALAAVTWRLRLQPTDPGWVDLGAGAPLQSSRRARTELGWAPAVDSRAALEDLLAGMRAGAGSATPALARRGLLTGRHEPAS